MVCFIMTKRYYILYSISLLKDNYLLQVNDAKHYLYNYKPVQGN